jgi:hypothetical protein
VLPLRRGALSGVRSPRPRATQFPRAGDGRVITLPAPVTLAALVARVKAFLALDHVQVSLAAGALPHEPATADAVRARSADVLVTTVGVCAGSGKSVLADCKAGEWRWALGWGWGMGGWGLGLRKCAREC